MSGPVLALCGGVGGAKLAHGLALTLAPEKLSVLVNTGDDFRHLGLHIAPDLDSVMYALAGLSDPVRGWGRREETWTFMEALRGLGAQSWFQLGDADLAVHVERSWRLAAGATLTEVTAHLSRALGIRTPILPMSDDPVSTRVRTDAGWLDFQDYFVRRRCQPIVHEIRFEGAGTARPQPQAMRLLEHVDLRGVVICPSNPFVSIEPILALPGIRAALQCCRAPVLAVTPIIAGKAVKGPAAKMLQEMGHAIDGAAVARRYADIIDAFVIDASDPLPQPLEGVQFLAAPTLMRTDEDRAHLAHAVLEMLDRLGAAEASRTNPPIAEGADHG